MYIDCVCTYKFHIGCMLCTVSSLRWTIFCQRIVKIYYMDIFYLHVCLVLLQCSNIISQYAKRSWLDLIMDSINIFNTIKARHSIASPDFKSINYNGKIIIKTPFTKVTNIDVSNPGSVISVYNVYVVQQSWPSLVYFLDDWRQNAISVYG